MKNREVPVRFDRCPEPPVFFSPCRHLVVESVIASVEGTPTKWGRQKLFPGKRGGPGRRRFHASASLCDLTKGIDLMVFKTRVHSNNSDKSEFRRKLNWGLFLEAVQTQLNVCLMKICRVKNKNETKQKTKRQKKTRNIKETNSKSPERSQAKVPNGRELYW